MRMPVLALLLALPGTAAATVACPQRLPEIAPGGFERGGLGAGRGANSPLREAWLIDGLPGEETAGAPAILAPDERRGRPPRVVNGWVLPANEPRLLVCIYAEGVWLRLALPPGLRRCTQTAGPEPMAMRCE